MFRPGTSPCGRNMAFLEWSFTHFPFLTLLSSLLEGTRVLSCEGGTCVIREWRLLLFGPFHIMALWANLAPRDVFKNI
jgi:hypothetical protein